MAMDSTEAEELIKASQKTGAILQIGHLERFNAAVVALKKEISNLCSSSRTGSQAFQTVEPMSM